MQTGPGAGRPGRCGRGRRSWRPTPGRRGDAHDRGGLADALRCAPAVAALDRPEGRDRGRALLRVAGHRPSISSRSSRRAVDFVELRDLLGGRRCGIRPSVTALVERQPFGLSGAGRPSTGLIGRSLRGSGRASRGCDQVGDVVADRHVAQRLQVDEGGVAQVDARRLRRAVGDDEAAELAARRLDRVVDLARGDPEALGDELEVVDQRLHRGRRAPGAAAARPCGRRRPTGPRAGRRAPAR